MELLPKSVARRLPTVDEICEERDATVRIKLFDPSSPWAWYVIAFDAPDLFYGLVHGFEDELGFFSLAELSRLRTDLGRGIERDPQFQPAPLSEIRRQLACAPKPIPRRRTRAGATSNPLEAQLQSFFPGPPSVPETEFSRGSTSRAQ